MKKAILFSTLIAMSLLSYSQSRHNSPILTISEEPTAILEESVTGWSYSLDGKWISGENRIYKRILSSNIEQLEEDQNELGIDNFESISTYEFMYGEDTLLLILKPFTEGAYEYPRSGRGWDDWRSVHYFVIEKPKSEIASIKDTNLREYSYRLRASGTVQNVSRRRTLERIIPRINLEESSNRYLILQAEVYAESEIVRFMLYSNHQIFHDVRGVISDVTIRGNSLFGTPRLLEYVYFECDLNQFAELGLM